MSVYRFLVFHLEAYYIVYSSVHRKDWENENTSFSNIYRDIFITAVLAILMKISTSSCQAAKSDLIFIGKNWTYISIQINILICILRKIIKSSINYGLCSIG